MSISIPEASITVSAARWASDPPKLMDYEHTVAIVIVRGDIAKTKCGELVLRRIKGGPGSVEIYPRYDPGENAEANFKFGNFKTGRDPKTIAVWYTPQHWDITPKQSRDTIPPNLRAFEPGMLRDEVLFHELVHSGRLLDGFRQKNQKLKPNPDDVAMYASEDIAGYEDVEEFVTILVSNIYLSEKGQKVFRASHGVPNVPLILDQAQSSSEGFLTKASNLALVKQFCETDPLAPKIANIDTPFNPVRAFFNKNPKTLDINKSLQKK